MKTITLKQAKQIKFNKATVALGTFDGLHIGHMALIEAAKKHEGDTVAFTFDALPVDVFNKQHKPMQLFTFEEKVKAFEKTGIDYLCFEHFDEAFADIDKHDFEKMLTEVFAPENVIAGYNYTFGKMAQGTARVLKKDSAEFGYSVEVIPKVIKNGIPVSSTKIRELIWKGRIETANIMLGYDYEISGEVVHGNKIGKSLGFPTANINIPQEKIVPKDGVYSAMAQIDGKEYASVCNIGVKPTISDKNERTVEVHIIDFEGHVYDRNLKIGFKKRIRDEIRFESHEKLSQQIEKDIISARRSFI